MTVGPFVVTRQVDERPGETIEERKIVRVDIIGTEGISSLDISYVDGEFYPTFRVINAVNDVYVFAGGGELLLRADFRKIRLVSYERKCKPRGSIVAIGDELRRRKQADCEHRG